MKNFTSCEKPNALLEINFSQNEMHNKRETGRVSRETRDSENNTENAPCKRRGHYSRETAKRTLSEEDISCEKQVASLEKQGALHKKQKASCE